MRTLIRKLIKIIGYTLVNSRELAKPQCMLPLKIKHFFDIYFVGVDPKTFFFVQIGAADGKVNDPIYEYVTKYGLRGVAVEPQPDMFRKLRDTYRDYQVTCVQGAIAKTTGTQRLWTVKRDSGLYGGDVSVWGGYLRL